MPWQQQGGSGGGGGGPWGSGPTGGGSGGRGGPQPPDFDELLRKGQERFKGMMPGGLGAKGIVLIALVLFGMWLFSGVYRVEPGEQGVELLFGKANETPTGPGLHFWFPTPIGSVERRNVDKTNTLSIGFRSVGGVGHNATVRDVSEESLMVTGDQNIIDIDFVVQYRIKNLHDFLFKIREPEATAKLAAESAIREVVGQTSLEDALAKERQRVEDRTKTLLQTILDSYGAGIFVSEVKMQKVDPPQPVIDAFNDVQRARQDKERQQNEAEAYSNDIVPKAKGEAQRMIQEATAYRERLIKEADGEAKRFLSVYEAYKGGVDVTTKRLYLERMQDVLRNANKIIIDKSAGGSGVVPYLPLNELQKRTGDAPPTATRSGNATPGGR